MNESTGTEICPPLKPLSVYLLCLHFHPEGTYSPFNKVVQPKIIMETRSHFQGGFWAEKGDCCFGTTGKYDLITPTNLGPVCCDSIQSTRLSTNSLKTPIHPGSWQHVMWPGDSSPHPQLGQMFLIVWVQFEPADDLCHWSAIPVLLPILETPPGSISWLCPCPPNRPDESLLCGLYSSDESVSVQPWPPSSE